MSNAFSPLLPCWVTRRAVYPAGNAFGALNTRATSLSWPDDVRQGFNTRLRRLPGDRTVPLTAESLVTMARVPGGG